MRLSRLVLAPLVAVGALSLSACFVLPPSAPAAVEPPAVQPPPTQEPTSTQQPTTAPDPEDTVEASPSTEPSEPSAAAPPPPADGAYDHQVDDGLGDTWSYTVTGVEDGTAIDPASIVPDGHRAVSVLLDVRHDVGAADFITCFDVVIIGDDGARYSYADTYLQLFAQENDLLDAELVPEGGALTGGRVVIAVPEGVQADQVEVTSNFGDGTSRTDI